MRILQTDVAIIGAGSAGLPARRAAIEAGASVILIEGGPHGTTCARVGCMPSKLLIAAAEAAHAAREAPAFGVHPGQVRIDGVQVMQRVRSERDRFVGFVLDDVAAMPDAEKLQGHARFLSDTELQVDDHTRVQARSVVIATGTRAVIPEIYRDLGDRLAINDDVFSWTDLPRSVAVIGTGVIGLELGQALHRLGVRVAVFGRRDTVAGISDPLVNRAAVDAFAAEFPLRLNTEVLSAKRHGEGVMLEYRGAGQASVQEAFDIVLVAAGRKPDLSGLALENTGARLDEHGMPAFDRQTLQLEGCPIFLAGDVNGLHPVLHEAADDGRIAGRNAALYPQVQAGQRRAPLGIVFTEPQVAFAGQRFRALPQEEIAIGEVRFANQGRSRIMRRNQGLLRVYADRASGRFLGAEMAGPSAEHLGHLLAWAVQQQLTIPQMLAMPFYHPVVEEGLRTALRGAAKGLGS